MGVGLGCICPQLIWELKSRRATASFSSLDRQVWNVWPSVEGLSGDTYLPRAWASWSHETLPVLESSIAG